MFTPKKGSREEDNPLTKPSEPSLYPSWKRNNSDSEFSDQEGNAQSKLRYREMVLVSCFLLL